MKTGCGLEWNASKFTYDTVSFKCSLSKHTQMYILLVFYLLSAQASFSEGRGDKTASNILLVFCLAVQGTLHSTAGSNLINLFPPVAAAICLVDLS